MASSARRTPSCEILGLACNEQSGARRHRGGIAEGAFRPARTPRKAVGIMRGVAALQIRQRRRA